MFWTSSILNGCITSNGFLNYQYIQYSTIYYWGEWWMCMPLVKWISVVTTDCSKKL